MDKDGSTKGEVEHIEDNNIMKELVGSDDEGVEPTEGRSETETMTFPWRPETCGRMCQGMCPVDTPSQGGLGTLGISI